MVRFGCQGNFTFPSVKGIVLVARQVGHSKRPIRPAREIYNVKPLKESRGGQKPALHGFERER